MKKEAQGPRKIVKRDITEDQFMAVLKQVCQPLKKPLESNPTHTETTNDRKVEVDKHDVV